MATTKVGKVIINFGGNTVELELSAKKIEAILRQLNNKVTESSQHMISQNQAAAAGLRVIDGGLNNNMRAVENFMTKVLGLGPVLKAAFPVIGAVAMGGMIIDLGEKFYKFFKDLGERSEATNKAFAELNQTLRVTAADLQLANDKLDNELAKIQGKPENNLKVALDETTAASEKLNESIDHTMDNILKRLADAKNNFIQDILTGQAGTDDLVDQFKNKFMPSLRGATPEERKNLIADQIAQLEGLERNAAAAQATRWETYTKTGKLPQLQTNRLRELNAEINLLKNEDKVIDLTEEGAKKKGAVDLAQIRKQNEEVAEKKFGNAWQDAIDKARSEGGERYTTSEELGDRRDELTALLAAKKQFGYQWVNLTQEIEKKVADLEQKYLHERDTLAERSLHEKEEAKKEELAQNQHLALQNVKASEESSKRISKELPPEFSGKTGPSKETQFQIIDPQRELEQMRRIGERLLELARLAKAGHPNIALLQDEINNEQRNLNLMEKGAFTLGQMVDERTKILKLQADLNAATKGEEAQDRMLSELVDEKLRLGTLRDGWDAFWIEMQEQAKKPGVILFDGMNDALNKLSGSIAAVMSGGKGHFSAALKEIGAKMNEEGIRSILQQGLGAIGKRMPGLGIPNVKRDGQTVQTAILVHDVGAALAGVQSSSDLEDYLKGNVGLGKSPNEQLNLPIPGTVMTVADIMKTAKGEKTPASGGKGIWGNLTDIFSGQNKKNPFVFNMSGGGSGGMAAGAPTPFGSTYYITVDARGADENVIYQRVASGVLAAHNAAVGNAVQATFERAQRTPQ